ncbi:uncharacterized protein LOC128042298 [Gossypium raimondii]|uniref:uncharacterized protein LOC128042298 n=1 Tax=Gossypium raimondii TaxID=29730 RepID=UPI00227C9A68|nr:uncharacterized protein LOC128042298 [Gossypium raimondii]
MGYSSRDRDTRHSNPKPQATSVASVTSVRNTRLECKRYNISHYGECRIKNGACFRCGSFDHYLRDCLEKSEKEKVHTARLSNTAARGRPPRNPKNVNSSHGVTKDTTVRSEARALARVYAIRAREDASTPDVITSTFSIYDTGVTALIDPGSTHSYVCLNLMSNKNLPIESIGFVVKVLDPLSQYVVVDKICNNCPLMTQGYSFLADLMLLSFDEFDKYVRKGCNAYLSSLPATKVSELKLESVPVVCEYFDVFLEELPRLPPIRDVEFAIELVPRTSLISIAPYIMASVE